MNVTKCVAGALFALALTAPAARASSMLESAMRADFLPEFDRSSKFVARIRPDREYAGSEWKNQTRTIVGTYVVDLTKAPVYGGDMTIAQWREAGREIRGQIPMFAAKEKRLIIKMFCGMAAVEPEKMKAAVAALRDYDITIHWFVPAR
jgi:hypothetical protein